MRRSVLAVALLLATAPIAGATEIPPTAKPELRAVEVAAPAIRKDLAVAPARAEAERGVAAKREIRIDTTTLVLVVLAAIGVIAIVGAL